ncbi:MAG: RDD family protein [Leptospira bouyouniensis]|uniref:RDD domain-containing protein n=1 Tax=Leptospira bouyouniensis TaxID=2484911 RepID=A0A7I0IKA1_9LEPT|nr:RDD family protein [Leptospira bouyouniensis]TGL03537.1 hypothetical protein EHQ43_17420 [Leptospira bouyouniensis]
MSQYQNYNIPYGVTLATPVKRFLAAIIDIGIIYGSGIFVLLIMFLVDLWIQSENQISLLYLFCICLAFILFPFVFNMYLLEKYGQSMGKKIIKIKIIDESGAMISTDRLIMLRHILPAILFNIPILGFIFFLLDSVLIFSKTRQCLHDRFAKTIVINC